MAIGKNASKKIAKTAETRAKKVASKKKTK